MARSLPRLDDAIPFATAAAHGEFRGWLEHITSNDPYAQMDWATYSLVGNYASRSDYLPIIEEVIKRRLAHPGPGADKVSLPPSSPLGLSTSVILAISRRLPHLVPTPAEREAESRQATILAQLLPPASLIPLLDPLKARSKPKDDHPQTYLHATATKLVESAEKAKTEAGEVGAKFKWEVWCAEYGTPVGGYEWRGMPQPEPVEWGMWGLMWVPPDEWWKEPEKTD